MQFFDILVGYFRTSGFHLLHGSFDSIEKIRILVGLNLDRLAFDALELSRQLQFDFQSTQQLRDGFTTSVANEMEHSEDSYDTEVGVRKFIEFLRAGKVEMKAHPSQKIHAKVYVSRFFPEDRDHGRVVTGSSNFSYAGLEGQYEFNVELKDRQDVDYALGKFEQLWAEAVDISAAYVDAIHKRTWLNDQILPYELYLKFLYEYFKEDINIDQESDFYLPDGFMELFYQKQAVTSAKRLLDAHGGVFLADVVGLGKTYISALLAQQLPGRKLVICPPVLKEYWKSTFVEFGVGAVKVESMGKLDRILEDVRARPDYFDYVFIDEAHRFRNEGTQSYEILHDICRGKKVILVSATPLNNTIKDILSQLKLFQSPQKSTIPGVRNLEAFFGERIRELEHLEKGTPEYVDAFRRIAAEVRQSVLNYVMVRRTRREIVRFFAQDMQQQGLHFPEVAEPKRIVYQFDAATDGIFTQTIDKLKEFRYARYTPFLYLRRGISSFEAQSQRNVGGFMKGILVKRLESSFFAFKNTLRRFIQSYHQFIDMLAGGTVLIGKDIRVNELLESDNEEELLRLIEAGKVQRFQASDFESRFESDLRHDLALLMEVERLWRDLGGEEERDPKLDQFIHELTHQALLKRKQMIVFTESSETGRYLFEHLNHHFPDQVLFYSSSESLYQNGAISKVAARELIEANYDPRCPTPVNSVRILVSTDVLAEGINLHRSNIVINYDLPWNPTRILQRVGRVNRVGTIHDQVVIFNFFPTAQSDAHLGLEENIKGKIQAFHDMLGEDAKYLTDEESVTQHELFGNRLYARLNRKDSYEGEGDERSELEFLQIIRKVRDEQPDLFAKIRNLPKKARSGREMPGHTTTGESGQVLSFFRRGLLKKFYLHQGNAAIELPFLDAADLLRCDPESRRVAIPSTFYEMLAENKRLFAEATASDAPENRPRHTSTANVTKVIKHLKAFQRDLRYTEDDEAYVRRVIAAFQAGDIPSTRTKRLLDKLLNIIDPLQIVAILRSEISLESVTPSTPTNRIEQPVEVILSEYFGEGV